MHHFQIVEAVGHGERLVGGHSSPVDQVGGVEGQQAEQADSVAQVAQLPEFGEIGNALALLRDVNNNNKIFIFVF